MNTLELEPKTAALVLIDLQQALAAMKTAPYAFQDVVQRCAALAARFREAGAMVVYVKVNMADMVKLAVDAPMRDPSAPPPPPAAMELVPEAGRQSSDLLITKRHWSAFLGTNLEQELRSRGVRTMAIGGVATNFGVESTARDAAGLGFDVVCVEDAMTTLSAEAHQFATTLIFPRLARVRKAAEVTLRGA